MACLAANVMGLLAYPQQGDAAPPPQLPAEQCFAALLQQQLTQASDSLNACVTVLLGPDGRSPHCDVTLNNQQLWEVSEWRYCTHGGATVHTVALLYTQLRYTQLRYTQCSGVVYTQWCTHR